ncbi:MAG: glycosyl transferase [Chitinophagales bacterium]|nr:MAG: glycosyl transferase [Chitinophagales bacterium]
MHVLFLVPYPQGEAPSQRFRFEQYFAHLQRAGIRYTVSSFIDRDTWKILYKKGHLGAKLLGMVKGIFRRIRDVFRAHQYDYVFIHREAAPFGPPVFEWLIARVVRKKMIYDFDDAIWLENVSESNRVFSRLKWYGKVQSVCQWAHLISVGNDYLRDYALQYNRNVVVNPTVVDTEHHYNRLKEHREGKVVIGWTGTHTTLRYFETVCPILKSIEEKQNVEIRVIADMLPAVPLKTLQFIRWNKTTEIDDLLTFDIGIMPLVDNAWTRGKCGFKLIQYLALSIPAVASEGAMSRKIIDHQVNGYICQTPEEWEEALLSLINDTSRRKQFGLAGRKKIESHFSVTANAPAFLAMFA